MKCLRYLGSRSPSTEFNHAVIGDDSIRLIVGAEALEDLEDKEFVAVLGDILEGVALE
jgi:hypothetical protein